jgi:MFS superfamily sulfate permease-like transporter
MTNRTTLILVGIIVALAVALAFVLGQQSRPNEPEDTPASEPLVLNAAAQTPLASGKQYTERFKNGTSLTFLPTSNFRKLVAFRMSPISPTEDTSCTDVYTKREEVRKINYAWDFVISSFETWNDDEGKQEYIVSEEDLPKAYQGSLHDIVRSDRMVTIEKQRCGMGQIEGLVSVSL